jgi:hypothetical protein
MHLEERPIPGEHRLSPCARLVCHHKDQIGRSGGNLERLENAQMFQNDMFVLLGLHGVGVAMSAPEKAFETDVTESAARAAQPRENR